MVARRSNDAAQLTDSPAVSRHRLGLRAAAASTPADGVATAFGLLPRTALGCPRHMPSCDNPTGSRCRDHMITVHHLNNSRSQRVLWLLEELDIDYRVVRYQRDANLLAPPELRNVHPLGKSPVISDGNTTVAESGAIIEYLIGRYGNGRLIPPADTPQRLRYTYWLHYAEGSAMTPLLLSLIFRRMPKAPMPFFVRPIVRGIADKAKTSYVDPQLNLHFDFMENELAKYPWFAGEEFSAADIQMSFPVEGGQASGLVGASRPKLTDFLQRIHKRPPYQRALEEGGEFAMLG
jgi:glutathione S-transferase